MKLSSEQNIGLVSVIIPNYNHSRYLQDRIESVLAQTYRNIEIIILDDASTDNSRAVLEGYRSQPKVSTIIYNDTNSGNTFRQWSKGLTEAKGELVWIAESDDVADDQFLEKLVPVFHDHATVGMTFSSSYKINGEGKITGDWNDWYKEFDNVWDRGGMMNGKDVCCNYLTQKNVIVNASAVLFSKPVIESALQQYLKEQNFKLVGDWYLYSLILLQYDLYYYPELLNYHRHHETTVRKSTHIRKKRLESIKLRNFMLKTFPMNNVQKTRLKERFTLETHWYNNSIGASFVQKILHLFVVIWFSRELAFYLIMDSFGAKNKG